MGVGRVEHLVIRLMAFAFVAVSVSGCSTPAPAVACVPGSVGVVWSSVSAPDSEIQLFRDGEFNGTAVVSVQGISTVATPQGDDPTQYLISDGNANHDRTSLVRFDRATCSADAHRLDTVVPLASAVVGDTLVTASQINGEANLRRHTLTGDAVERVELADILITALAATNGRLFGFARLADDTSAFVEIGLGPLRVVRRTPLPDLDTDVLSFVVRGDTVWFPMTASERTDAPDHRLGVLDLTSGTLRTIDLGADLPYLVSAQGDSLYVAHTFMNPGFRPMSAMRHVSRVDLATGRVEGFDLAVGISLWRVTSDRLVVVGEAPDEIPHLVEYRLTDMQLLHDTPLSPPPGRDHYYPAEIVHT